MAAEASESVAVVVGRNCKRIRSEAGVTQNVLAKHARDAGLRWTASKVGDFESGRTSPTFATVLAATSALAAATQTDVQVADLLDHDGYVELTDMLDPQGEVLQQLLRGERSWRGLKARDVGYFHAMAADPNFVGKLAEDLTAAAASADWNRYPGVPVTDLIEISRRSGLDEERLAKRLEVSTEILAAASWTLWRRSFSDERDARAGADANAQKRGRVSRTLQDELRDELRREASDGDDQ